MEVVIAGIGSGILDNVPTPPAEKKPAPTPKAAPAPVSDDPLAALGL